MTFQQKIFSISHGCIRSDLVYGLIRPWFFEQGQHLDDQTYHDKLSPFFIKRKVMNCSDIKITGCSRIELASGHTDQKVQQWCKKKNFKFFIQKERWPPSSFELNPLDYSIWDHISKHVKYGNVKKLNDLRLDVEKGILKKVGVNYMRDVISIFLGRLCSIENHNGGLVFYEHP